TPRAQRPQCAHHGQSAMRSGEPRLLREIRFARRIETRPCSLAIARSKRQPGCVRAGNASSARAARAAAQCARTCFPAHIRHKGPFVELFVPASWNTLILVQRTSGSKLHTEQLASLRAPYCWSCGRASLYQENTSRLTVGLSHLAAV